MEIKVTKRDGTHQNFDLEKVHKVLEWAVEGHNRCVYVRDRTKSQYPTV